jgi:hypothetical protein
VNLSRSGATEYFARISAPEDKLTTGSDFIVFHRMMDEFLELYSQDFDITGGQPMMETFIELQFIQCDTSIRINVDY